MYRKMFKKTIFSAIVVLLLFAIADTALIAADCMPCYKYFYVKSVQAGYRNLGYWDQPGNHRRYKSGANLALYAKDHGVDQQFRFESAGDGWYYIVSGNGGYVDVSGGRNGDGVNMHIWSSNRTVSQKFRFKHLGNGRYKIYTWWGRVICTPRKYSNGSNVHTWGDHKGPWMEWSFYEARTNRKYLPSKNRTGGQVSGYNINPEENIRDRVNHGNQDVEIWKFNPKDRKNRYKKVEQVRTDSNGRFKVPQKYSREHGLFLMSRFDDRETAYKKFSPARGENSIQLVSNRYDNKNYVLMNTKHRGKQYYYFNNGYLYMKKGIVTRKDSFFFPHINNRNTSQIRSLIRALGGSSAEVYNDRDLVKRIEGVWNFLSKHAKHSLGSKDPEIKEAKEYLFRNSYTSPNQTKGLKSVKSWPSIQDYADTFDRYGYIPMGNCTAWSQATATLLYAAGVPADSFFVAKINYDMSWIVEHWIIAFNMNNRWYTLDPQTSASDIVNDLKNFGLRKNPYYRNRKSGFDSEKPFEAVLLPGSGITHVPFCGNPEILKKRASGESVPSFFMDHRRFIYDFKTPASKSHGEASVISVNGNKISLSATYAYTDINTGRSRSASRVIVLRFENGKYIKGRPDQYQLVGKVDTNGQKLVLSGSLSGITLTVK